MLSKIRAAIIWGKMRQRYLNRDFSGAAALAEEYKKTGVTNDVFSTFEATLDVLNHRSNDALMKYRKVIDSIKENKGNDKRYIYEYCMSSIKSIEGDPVEAESHRKNALRIAASNYVRKSLPLPDRPITEL